MVFSSLEFVFFFLPIVLIGNWIFHRSLFLQNIFLLISSLFFYGWSDLKLVILLLLVVVLNWGTALIIDKCRKKWSGTIAIVIDIGILFFFKYFTWTISGINNVFGLSISIREIALPLGISFYTFQAISYIADVMHNRVEAQKNPLYAGLYISFFPQLIAGPIVRYTDIESQIKKRCITMDSFSKGTIRFLTGFSKKILLADSMAVIVNKAWGLLDEGELGLPFAWLGAIAFTFQIFFDFSGYSDMAIGLAGMFGFIIPENFNNPYMCHSIRDFWRRWHISLSSWFRDYVYIPLGGNRVSPKRMYLNISIVWLLTGLWHGANLTFLFWGICYGVMIIIERILDIDTILSKGRARRIIYRCFSFVIIMLLWVVFRSNCLSEAMRYISKMFSFSDISHGFSTFYMYLCEMKVELAVCALISCIPLSKKFQTNNVYQVAMPIVIFMLFIVSIAYLVKGYFSPFLYFDF